MPATVYRIAGALLVAVLVSPAHGQLLTHRDLSYAVAKTIAETAVESCKSKGFNVSATVVDRAGDVMAQLRGDNAAPHTMENSRRKAYTARTLRIPSAEFAKLMETDPVRKQQATLPSMIGLPGGLPIKVGDEVIGAAAVSGSPGNNDEPCVQAGLDKVADQLK